MPEVLPSFDSLQDDSAQPTTQLPQQPQAFDSLVDDSEKHDSPLGYAAAASVGALNTALPVVGSKLMGDPELQRELKESNPISYGAGQVAGLMFSPVGKAIGALGKAAEAAVGAGTITGAAVNMAAQSAALQATDEVAKFVLNDPHQSIQTALTDLSLSAVIGGALGSAGGLASKVLDKVVSADSGQFLNDFRNRVVDRVSIYDEGDLAGPVGMGAKAADAFMNSKLAGKGLGFEAGQIAGHMTGIPGAGYIGGLVGAKYLGSTMDAIIKPLIRGGMELSAPAVDAAANLIKSVAKGEELISKTAKSIFESGTSTYLDAPSDDDTEKLREHLKTLEENPEAISNIGGDLGQYLPEQQTALAATAQNTVNYLQSQYPREIQPGVLDRPIQPSRSKELAFDRTLSIAQQPLVTLNYLKKGSLNPKDVTDLKAMYPALVPQIVQKVNNHMIDHISKGNSVPYKIRGGLSLLMGQPMDSTLTPQAIQSAQATYAQMAPQQPQGAPRAKKGTAKLGKSAELAQTPSEARLKALSKA